MRQNTYPIKKRKRKRGWIFLGVACSPLSPSSLLTYYLNDSALGPQPQAERLFYILP